MFTDDPEHPEAPLWPSERLPVAVEALNLPAVTPSTFRKVLQSAAAAHLPGPTRDLHPHLLRHACATHNYEAGMRMVFANPCAGTSVTRSEALPAGLPPAAPRGTYRPGRKPAGPARRRPGQRACCPAR